MRRFHCNAITTLALLCFSTSIYAAGRPLVTDIAAEPGAGGRIAVSWTLPQETEPEITSLLVFKGTRPFYSWQQIVPLPPAAVLSPRDTGWADSVSDYKDYYYAVVALTPQGMYDILIPSVNATVNGAHLRLPQREAARDADSLQEEPMYPEGELRETPLPYVDLFESAGAKPVNMGSAAKEAARQLAGRYAVQTRAPLDVYVFEEDLIAPAGGDDFLLFDILRRTFIQMKYDDAQTELSRLLATNVGASVARRAQFYLGESYYFEGNYSGAVASFLQVSDIWPALTKKWTDSALDLMAMPENNN